MGDNIPAANPEKDMLRLRMVRCPHMNTITMEGALNALKPNRYVIEVPEDPRPRGEVGAEDTDFRGDLTPKFCPKYRTSHREICSWNPILYTEFTDSTDFHRFFRFFRVRP